jgi:serine/threonine protein kinase
MLTSNFDAKLGDFSLSKIINENSKYTTSRSGTLPYLAPECVTKKTSLTYQSSFKADVFSLGIVMYFFLFNTHPFQYKVILIY